MAQPVVHFEIIGPDPARLRGFYGDVFGWEFDTSGEVSPAVSDPRDYGFVDRPGGSIPGGVGGGGGHAAQTVFYVGVPDVASALAAAAERGATVVVEPSTAPSGLVMGQFRDPAGNLIGLATPPA